MATDPASGWGRPRATWSGTSEGTRTVWARRGRRFGLTGRQAHAWARLSPGERQRYTRYGARHGLGWYEVYREPLLVTAARRHPSPLSAPWLYRARTLHRRWPELARVAPTRAGLAVQAAQRTPLVRDDLHLGDFWLYVDPDTFGPTEHQAPWHSSLTFRDGPSGDFAAWVDETGIDWVVLTFDPVQPAFVWVVWFPFISPGGGARH